MTLSSPIALGFIITLYVLSSVSGLALIKSASQIVSAPFAAGAALYGAGFLIWILVILRALPLSIAFPISAGALIVGTQIGGAVFLKEPMNGLHITGVLFTVIGITLIFFDKGRP